MRGMLVVQQKSADAAICHVKLPRGRSRREDTWLRSRSYREEAKMSLIRSYLHEGDDVLPWACLFFVCLFAGLRKNYPADFRWCLMMHVLHYRSSERTNMSKPTFVHQLHSFTVCTSWWRELSGCHGDLQAVWGHTQRMQKPRRKAASTQQETDGEEEVQTVSSHLIRDLSNNPNQLLQH